MPHIFVTCNHTVNKPIAAYKSLYEMMDALTIHQVQDETQFIRSVEGICHTHYERTVLQGEKEIEGVKQARQGW